MGGRSAPRAVVRSTNDPICAVAIYRQRGARFRRATISTGDAADHCLYPPMGGLLIVTARRARASACAVCLDAEGRDAVSLK